MAYFDRTLLLSFDFFGQLLGTLRSPANGFLTCIQELLTERLFSNENCASIRMCSCYFLTFNVTNCQTQKNLSLHVSTQTSKYMLAQGVKMKERKENYWIKNDYITYYAILEYRLRNRCYRNNYSFSKS